MFFKFMDIVVMPATNGDCRSKCNDICITFELCFLSCGVIEACLHLNIMQIEIDGEVCEESEGSLS
jgi:hypothetical protein